MSLFGQINDGYIPNIIKDTTEYKNEIDIRTNTNPSGESEQMISQFLCKHGHTHK